MIAYILKSGLCLAMILLVYKVLLARERMYIFNRYFLLFGLCFSFLVPFITFETVVEIPMPQDASLINFENMNVSDVQQPVATLPNGIATWMYVIAGLYGLGLLLLSLRFLKNIFMIFSKITKNVKVFYKKASLVLLKENVLPHTFLHYIFLEKELYDTQNIAEELYTHELAHVSQKHTLDIILIELIQIVFWFNPILIYYKKAIQLNHEFLADDAVLKSNTQIPAYQQLLLENAHWNHNLHLASNLNFSVTKKRLQMMTKHTSRVRAWLFASLTIPIFISALFLFSTRVIAQETTAEIIEIPATNTIIKEIQDPKEYYYKNATFIFEDEQGAKVSKKYTELTIAEKARLIPPPKTPVAKRPTASLLSDWSNKDQFAIWIDGKVVDNSEISNHTIVHYGGSFVHKNARSKRFPQPYQMQLYTATGFKSLKEELAKPLRKGAVLHVRKHKDQKTLQQKKVGSISKENTEKNVRQELATINQLPINYINENSGPNVTELPSNTEVREKRQTKDIRLLINKNEQFLLNDNYVFKMKSLDKSIKSELAKIKHKNHRTASVIYDVAVSKEFVLKTIAVLKDNKIYDITTRNSNSVDEIRLPPPPPVAKKPVIIEVKDVNPNGNVSEKDAKAIRVMHAIIKDQKVETTMINGKKHYYVVKNGRKFIFNEKSQLVDEKGNLLPPPPPPPPAPKKTKKTKKTKVKTPKLAKEEKKKVKEKLVGRKAETMMINGKKHYYYIKNGQKFIYNQKHQLVDANGNLISKSGKTSEKSSEWKDVTHFLEKGK
ncbi:M56 family metallopeptidase [Kordia algicida OT-1]|uniref:Putative transcriptional regulator n=1 Tax=Kordia algicida OT-1 TaxID=391587 RepID=A9DJP9_9FLAO|nr:M56 family metallopeptidase [Kordia algicida]EDP98154.1 putative transcriptional regulator [Kordia algicida OT-1]